jgi:hypothetical protein
MMAHLIESELNWMMAQLIDLQQLNWMMTQLIDLELNWMMTQLIHLELQLVDLEVIYDCRQSFEVITSLSLY